LPNGGIYRIIGPVAEPAILCLETSTPRASIAILRGRDVLFEAAFTSDRSHNAGLFHPLQEALKVLPEGEKLATVIVGTGPGSYSGTRVGIAAAQGVAMVHGCPAVGISSLAAVACLDFSQEALAIGDARRGSAWWVKVEAGKIVDAPELLPTVELAGVLAQSSGLPVFTLEHPGSLGLSQAVILEEPDAVRLGQAWLQLADSDREALLASPPQPVYLQPPHITEAKGGHPLVGARRSGS
jgi:tRNA threonylcarbamoyladenosine biosynthesis protein TsaB